MRFLNTEKREKRAHVSRYLEGGRSSAHLENTGQSLPFCCPTCEVREAMCLNTQKLLVLDKKEGSQV